jgi:beta-fructofuranosidase
VRPVLHHTPATGWINDPQLAWHDGTYHLFFQHVPDRAEWDVGCRWGHATSIDLLSWTPGPVALAPDEDEDGCWSGCVTDGVVFYTAVSSAAPDLGWVRRAVPADGESWTTWAKQAVVAQAPPEALHFRDPFVHRDGDTWRMVVGGATAAGPALWAFRSEDLVTWEPRGLAASRAVDEDDGVWTGHGWECPSLLEVDGRTVLLVSAWSPDALHYLAYALCSPDGDRLHPGVWRRLSYGPSLYAGTAFVDAEGRPGLVAWLRWVGDPAAGWAGATSLPVRVGLDGDRLVVRPPDGLPPEADREWSPTVGEVLEGPGFALTAREGSVRMEAGAHVVELPWTGRPLRVVVDALVLEVHGDDGWAAVPLDH